MKQEHDWIQMWMHLLHVAEIQSIIIFLAHYQINTKHFQRILLSKRIKACVVSCIKTL